MQLARFTVAYWCVLIAALLPFACAWLAKSGGLGKPRKQGGFDNNDPRGWLARQTDWQARANAAQANSFEALPFFIGAVIIAHQLGAPQTRAGYPGVGLHHAQGDLHRDVRGRIAHRPVGDLGSGVAGEHSYFVRRLPLIASA